MGVMEKMRDSTKYILWVLIIAFGLLWGLADTRVFDAMMAGPRTLGEVNGESISYEEYNSRISYYLEQYSQRTGESITPEMRAYYEEQAWNELVASKLIQQKMDELGITVTDQELVEMITGPNPDQFIKQQFQREDGTINREALQQAIEAPENTDLWVMIEKQLRQKRRQEKMNTYVESALQISDEAVEQEYVRNNSFANVQFVRFPYADLPTDSIQVTESELRAYYDTHQDDFQRKEQYRFDYVGFSKAPTKEDTVRTIKEMQDLRNDFRDTDNDSLFLARYQSTAEYNDSYVKVDEVRDLLRPVLDLQEGEVTDVIRDNGTLHLVKLVDRRRGEVKFTDFAMRIKADPISTVDAQAEEADDFSFFAEQSSFDEEAERRNYEVKSAFATKGTPFVSGLGQSRQVLNYLESASEGQVSQPIELDQQFVVLKVNEVIPEGVRPFEEVRGQIETQVRNQKQRDMMVKRAAEYASNNQTLDAIAQAAGKNVSTAESVRMNANVIPGAGREPKVIGAIFGLQEGMVSSPIEGNSAAFVIKVNSFNKADATTMTADAAQRIRQQLKRVKQSTYLRSWMEQLKEEAEIDDYRDQVLQQI
jgi:peptidyl-prolyl cis-trans isomerase D